MSTAPDDAASVATIEAAPTTDYQLQEAEEEEPAFETFDDEPDASNYDAYEEDDEDGFNMAELLYSSASYNAIAKPVSLTMVLAALCVVLINDEQTVQQGEELMKEAYTVWKTDDSASFGTFMKSMGNAFVMVTVIGCMTFLIVLLYKFRCMKCLIGYMMFASASLLGVLGGTMLETAIYIYDWPVDKLTFYFFLYNFSIVGVMAVFWSKGISTKVTQGYLVCTSVILAWQLSHFDTWTTWTLLVMLALYDLCAVLTPCGPLKFLVNEMSQDDSPDMPGLLYEAQLPAEAQRPTAPRLSDVAAPRPSANQDEPSAHDVIADDRSGDADEVEDVDTQDSEDRAGVLSEDVTTDVPLALARVYNLPIVGTLHMTSGSPLLNGEVPETPTVQQLKSIVTVRIPSQGGRIEKHGRKTYLERDRFGNKKRTLWVDKKGKVFAESYDEDDDDDDDDQNSNTIRLGLGDFIFYSVLVSKAAQYSFATFASCMLVILAGLGGTLILLAVYHHALPALPISIFMGVICYVLVRLVVEPWIEAVMRQPHYV